MIKIFFLKIGDVEEFHIERNGGKNYKFKITTQIIYI